MNKNNKKEENFKKIKKRDRNNNIETYNTFNNEDINLNISINNEIKQNRINNKNNECINIHENFVSNKIQFQKIKNNSNHKKIDNYNKEEKEDLKENIV